MNDTVRELIERSNRLGSDPRNTNYAGGNTSAKGTAIDPVTAADVELMWVKGSGGDLGTLTEPGLAVLRLDRLRALAERLPGRGSRGRDGRGVRLLPARARGSRAVDRHRDARPRRRAACRPPPSRLRHRARHRGRRRGADQGVLRRPRRLGAVAAARLPARSRHRRDQERAPAGDRLRSRRPRHHGLGCDVGRVRGQFAGDHRYGGGLHRRARAPGAVRRGARRLPATPRSGAPRTRGRTASR